MSFDRGLQEKILEFFDESILRKLESSGALRTERAPIVRAKALSEDLMRKLIDKRICGIHIPGYVSKPLADRAQRFLLSGATTKRWHVGARGAEVLTDMNYIVGIPRERARTPKMEKAYLREALPSIRLVRKAFDPELSPIDRLRLELGEIWPRGLEIESFKGRPGLVGLVRVTQPETFFEGAAATLGVCHIDGYFNQKLLSANIYLKTPKSGGELKIWPIKLDMATGRNFTYQMIYKYAFHPGARDFLQSLLPVPHVVKPETGDLIILDSSRPHAVAGFNRGNRVAIQTFIGIGRGKNPSLVLSS